MINLFQKEEVGIMMNILKKYSGLLFFYLVIVGMILLVNARFAAIDTDSNVVTIAMSE